MHSTFSLAGKYLHYYITASSGKGHGIHSPFVFDFVENVLSDQRNFYAFEQIEVLRRQLLSDPSLLTVEDFGAGSSVSSSLQKSVSTIAKHAAKSKKYGQLLFKIANHYRPDCMLELGTSLGLSAAYLASARPAASLTTMEGSASIAGLAAKNFRALGLTNIDLMVGHFEELLPVFYHKGQRIDLGFIDGNHRKEPTLYYFDLLSRQVSAGFGMLIFDDIHWSAEMEQAWQLIKDDPRPLLTIDLFFMGIVFFGSDFKAKQHFTIRY